MPACGCFYALGVGTLLLLSVWGTLVSVFVSIHGAWCAHACIIYGILYVHCDSKRWYAVMCDGLLLHQGHPAVPRHSPSEASVPRWPTSHLGASNRVATMPHFAFRISNAKCEMQPNVIQMQSRTARSDKNKWVCKWHPIALSHHRAWCGDAKAHPQCSP